MLFIFLVFFFKQKTAYEMRISDWSSDVCSSDLVEQHAHGDIALDDRPVDLIANVLRNRGIEIDQAVVDQRQDDGRRQCLAGRRNRDRQIKVHRQVGARHVASGRSEEHTSELQSLMRISYAVFCLKKKKRPPKDKST